MAGRPTKLTGAVIDEICRLVRAWVPLSIAANSLGIDTKTVLGWRVLGAQARACEAQPCADPHHGPSDGEVSYAQFADEVQQAKGQAGVRASLNVAAKFEDDPRLAERWLATQYPEDFGPRAGTSQLQPSEPVGPPLLIRIVPKKRGEPDPDAITGRTRPTKASAKTGKTTRKDASR